MHWIIHAACLLHLTWGTMLLLGSSEIVKINAMMHLLQFVPGGSPILLGATLVAVSALGFWAVLSRPTRSDVIFLAPQQVVMILSAWSCVESSIAGQFADGTKLPGSFIFADQCWHVFSCVGHTMALVTLHLDKLALQIAPFPRGDEV